MRRLLGALLAGGLGCASPSPPAGGPASSAVAPAPAQEARPLPLATSAALPGSGPATSDGAQRFLAACREACAQRNMMRAVSAAMIDAQCEATCADAWSLPEVRARAAAQAHQAQLIRVRGRYVVAEDVRRVRLDDGSELLLASGPALGGASALEAGAVVIVVGTLEGSTLSDVTVIARAD